MSTLVSYRDREAVPHASSLINPGSLVTFQHAVMIDGQVAGTWRTAANTSSVVVSVFPLRRLTRLELRALAERVDCYARFLEVPVTFKVSLIRSTSTV